MYWNSCSADGCFPACVSSTYRSPTRLAQKKIRLRTGEASAFSSARAYTFSYTRGTAITIVGFTSPRFTTSVSMLSA